MSDYDALLARADEHYGPQGGGGGITATLIRDLAAALRAHREFVRAYDAKHARVTADTSARLDAARAALGDTPRSVVRADVDESSRETAGFCRSMENGTPLTCELQAGHDGPHSFDAARAALGDLDG